MRLTGQPKQNVRVQQDHFFLVTPHSTGIGDSISPTARAFPAMNPKMSRFSPSNGTTLATGLPLLVITSGSPVASTASRSDRHWALNFPAATRLLVPPSCSWSFYNDLFGPASAIRAPQPSRDSAHRTFTLRISSRSTTH